VLFGDYIPGRKLPVTFYKNSGQLHDYDDYSMKGRTYRYFNDPLFAFGYGLSYTTFQVGEAEVERLEPMPDEPLFSISVPVTNTGTMAGTEIVQLYIRNPQDPNGPLKSLRAFERVDVKPGQTGKATLLLDRQAFEFWDEGSNTMRVKPGDYEIFYGNSSQDKDLKTLTLNVDSASVDYDNEYFSLNEVRFENFTSNEDWLDNDYIRALRTYIDDYKSGKVKDPDLDKVKEKINGQFVVLNVEPFIMGGLFLVVAFLDSPNDVFTSWIYSDVDQETKTVSGYEVRTFRLEEEKSELTKEEILEAVKEHPELKLW
jgi:hypothetical protein